MQQEFSLTTIEVSNCLAYFSYAALLFTPIAGYLYNNFNKKAFIFGTNLIYLLGLAGVFLAPNYTMLISSRIMQGIGSAGLCILMPLLPAEFFQGTQRAGVMGKCNAAMAVGVTSLPPISGFLALYSWHYSVLVLFIPSLITLIMFFLTDFTAKYEIQQQQKSEYSFKDIFKTPGIIPLFISIGLVSGIDLAMPSVFSLYSHEELGFNSDSIGKVYAAGYTGMIVASTFLLVRIMKLKIFPLLLAVHGTLVIASLSCFTLLPAASAFFVFFIFYLLSGIIIPFTNYSISAVLPPSLLALGLTVSTTFFRAGQGLITSLFAWIKTEYGNTSAFMGIAVIFGIILCSLIYFIFRYRSGNEA